MKPSPEKVWALKTYPVPQDVTQLRGYLGLAQFFKKFIRNFSELAEPLHRMTQKGVTYSWNMECETSFKAIKNRLIEEAMLAHRDPKAKLAIHCDASNTALGSVLMQELSPGVYQPLQYGGRALNKHERRYSVGDKELLSLIYSLSKWKYIVELEHITVFTDHCPLLALFNKKDEITNGRLANWLDQFMSMTFTVKPVSYTHLTLPTICSV